MGNEVAQCCEEHKNMLTDWCLVDDLRGGTKAMRAAGAKYLPKRPMEEKEDWDARLAFATLLPAYTETTEKSVGRVFAEPLAVNDDVPRWIVDEVLPDVDKQGRNFNVWAAEWFTEGFDYGITHVVVESPRADGVQTREQQNAAGIRPYLIKIHARDVLGWRYKNDVLVQLRVRFWEEEEDGEFGVKCVEQIRVYDLLEGKVQVRVFIESSKDDWTVKETITTDLKAIPFVTLYTNRTGRLQAVPPNREMAYLNAKHWRVRSSNDQLVETASVPILCIIGGDGEEKIVIGAKAAVRLPEGSDMKFVEHSGAAIKAGKESLDGIVEEMRQCGAKLLAPASASKQSSGTQTGPKTATQVDEESAADNSQLGAMTDVLADTLAQVLDVIASFRNEPKGGTVKLQPNLDPEEDPTSVMANLSTLEDRSVISRQTMFERAQDVGVLPEDLKWEDEQQRIKEDMLTMPAPTNAGLPNDSAQQGATNA